MTIGKAWTAVLLLVVSSAVSAAECHVQLSGLSYPPLAAQARIQGVVQANALIISGQLASYPSLTGHPLLTSVAERAIERTLWANCEDGEQTLLFDFRLTDPCSPRSLSVEQTGPASFRVAMSQPNPCVFTISEYVVRRFLFWKKKVFRCEESCPPCANSSVTARTAAAAQLLRPALENQAPIGPAESKWIRQRVVDAHGPSLVRDEVEIALVAGGYPG